jgi:ribosomal protein S18 acetylase RimI-like enzyme
LAVLRDGELLGFYLATFGDAIIPLLGLRVIKRPDEAWADQITISGDHRREGLATELKRSMYAELRKRGIKTIYAATRVYNKAALESAHKFGIQKAFIFRYIKFINYRKLIYEKIHIQGGRIQKNSFSACARGVGAFQSRNDPIKSIKGPSLTQGNGGVYFFTIQTSELV